MIYEITGEKFRPLQTIAPHAVQMLSTGQGLFETMLYNSGKIWFWNRHMERIRRSYHSLGGGTLGISDAVEHQITGACSHLEGPQRLKLLVLFSFTEPDINPQFLLEIRPYSPPRNPLKLMTLNEHRTEYSFLARHKTLNYGTHLFNRHQAQKAGFFDVLYVMPDGRITETSIGNVFALVGNQLITPPSFLPILPGIIRELIIEHMNATEGIIKLEDLKYLDALFMTNSLLELRQIQSVDSRRFRHGGFFVRKIIKKWIEIKNKVQ